VLTCTRAACGGIPHKSVRKSGMPNIIEVLVGQVSRGGRGFGDARHPDGHALDTLHI